MKCEGIQGIRRLARHHPEVLLSQLHTVTLAITAEVRGQSFDATFLLVRYFIIAIQWIKRSGFEFLYSQLLT